MVFCSNCGEKLEDGMAFCTKCGTKVAVSSANAVPEQRAPRVTQALADRQPGVYQQPVRQWKGENALLRVAAIVAPAIWFVFAIAVILNNFVIGHAIDRENMLEAIIGPFVFLVILAIPTILNVLGQQKNNRVMIIIAGVLYFLSVLGIPSAIICCIALIKTKKNIGGLE
jgi:hypothetical protein